MRTRVAAALLLAALATGCGKTNMAPTAADALKNVLRIVDGCTKGPFKDCEVAHRSELETDRQVVCQAARATGHPEGTSAEAQAFRGQGVCGPGRPLRPWLAFEYVRLAGALHPGQAVRALIIK